MDEGDGRGRRAREEDEGGGRGRRTREEDEGGGRGRRTIVHASRGSGAFEVAVAFWSAPAGRKWRRRFLHH
jgi:hypothetical protein